MVGAMMTDRTLEMRSSADNLGESSAIRKKGAHALMANSVLAVVFVEIVGKAYEPF